jgi:GAF domain-containing protein
LILLISSDATLTETLSGMLPALAPFTNVTTTSQAQSYINDTTAKQSINLIFFDARDTSALLVDCNQQCHIPKDVPFIAIISDPAQREAVLEAGADDYLLTPLLADEVKVRLAAHLNAPHLSAPHLNAAIRGFSSLLEMVHQMSRGVLSTPILSKGIKNLAEIFHAPSAWLLLFDPKKETLDIAGGYNLPPLFQSGKILGEEAFTCTNTLLQDGSNIPQVVACPYLAQAEHWETNGLTHHLSIPLRNERQVIGVLNLAYPDTPQFSRTERRILTMVGQDIGILLEMVRWQEEIQTHATQTAFMVLLARSINKDLDLDTILSLTLEQVVSQMAASNGDIWLLSTDEQYLEQVSSLSASFIQNPRFMPASSIRRIKKDQGLIGRAFISNRSLSANTAATNPQFDAEVDSMGQAIDYALLAVPLIHHQKNIGVLALYKPHDKTFDDQDTVIIEGIAGLVSAAIANARLMQDIRNHADQQQILYDMSRQIAVSLDLPATLDRALRWSMRLSDSEIGLLWLVETSSPKNSNPVTDTLRLAALSGIDLPEEQQIIVALEQCLSDWVVQHKQAVIVNNPAADPRFDMSISKILNITPRNIIAVPMFYNDEMIGSASFINKTSDSFTETDLTLLSTAMEMVTIAVGNARLHDQTITLMKEREQMHKQIVQAERLATVGRLTASLSHEINNPMQAIRGALTLAQEDLHKPVELANYLQLSLEESERVIRLVDRMQQIYRPKNGNREILDMNDLLHEAVALAYKELRRQNIIIHTNLTPDLPSPLVQADQLHLVFLSLMLNLGSAVDAAGGGELYIRSYAASQAVCVEFSSYDPHTRLAQWLFVSEKHVAERSGDLSFGLFLSRDIIASHGGSIELGRQEQNFVCKIELPVNERTQKPQEG